LLSDAVYSQETQDVGPYWLVLEN